MAEINLLEEVYNLTNAHWMLTAKRPEMLVVSPERAEMMQKYVAGCMAYIGFSSLATMEQVSKCFGVKVAICENLDCDWKVY